MKAEGTRTGNWLTLKEAQTLIRKPDASTLKGLRDRAILAVLIGCGLRRAELANLTFDHIQLRENRWVLLDLRGKRNKTRTVPMPSWAKQAIDEWAQAAGIDEGLVLRPVNKGDNLAGDSISPKAVNDAVALYSPEGIAAHDLRRTHAKLAYQGGAALDQIQLTLGHASIATTERYLGVELDLHNSPSDHIKLRL